MYPTCEAVLGLPQTVTWRPQAACFLNLTANRSTTDAWVITPVLLPLQASAAGCKVTLQRRTAPSLIVTYTYRICSEMKKWRGLAEYATEKYNFRKHHN